MGLPSGMTRIDGAKVKLATSLGNPSVGSCVIIRGLFEKTRKLQVPRYSSLRATSTPAWPVGPERASGSSTSCCASLDHHPSLYHPPPW